MSMLRRRLFHESCSRMGRWAFFSWGGNQWANSGFKISASWRDEYYMSHTGPMIHRR